MKIHWIITNNNDYKHRCFTFLNSQVSRIRIFGTVSEAAGLQEWELGIEQLTDLAVNPCRTLQVIR